MTVKASCGNCGDIELSSGEIAVLLCEEGDACSLAGECEAMYMLVCPDCGVDVRKTTDRRMANLLIASGSHESRLNHGTYADMYRLITNPRLLASNAITVLDDGAVVVNCVCGTPSGEPESAEGITIDRDGDGETLFIARRCGGSCGEQVRIILTETDRDLLLAQGASVAL